jgi:DNA-binding transcriptional MocR family regulator
MGSSVRDSSCRRLAEFIAEGHLAVHVRRMRTLYAERQAVLCEALRQIASLRATLP